MARGPGDRLPPERPSGRNGGPRVHRGPGHAAATCAASAAAVAVSGAGVSHQHHHQPRLSLFLHLLPGPAHGRKKDPQAERPAHRRRDRAYPLLRDRPNQRRGRSLCLRPGAGPGGVRRDPPKGPFLHLERLCPGQHRRPRNPADHAGDRMRQRQLRRRIGQSGDAEADSKKHHPRPGPGSRAALQRDRNDRPHLVHGRTAR